MLTKVRVPRIDVIKALSQDRLFLIEMKIPCHLFSDRYIVSVIADLPYTLRKSLQTTSASPCRIYVTDFVSLIYNLKTMF